MKLLAVILLFAIALGAVIPPTLTLLILDQESTAIGTLDVCHSAAPSLSSNGETPCVNEAPCRLCQPAQRETAQIDNHLFQPFLIVLQDERPPKA